ncbi:MAG: bifunctional 4-hydroxy-2-oxoglutarate aldolase/2-dehydro-3-deoxy-phosphogluconate aldolase [Clostridia bacterium]|nr:bifunctional 4-hydroxy-2-oxoglutarate aldolase/2-dehydro-3-deoxy-phosphogluconate aldolase [Clostridia bacterium]
MNPILEQISNIGLVPVIKIDDANKAVPLVRALKKGGIPVAEVTFRTACAAEAIRNIAEAEPDVLVGAGTVISVEQAKAAVEAGAKYIISPGFDAEVVKWCIDNNVPITPGCSDASDVMVAAKLGLEVVKFFPAEAAGGLKVLKALAGPFPNMKFIPTGGIGPDNLGSYLDFKKVIACGGSWMVPGDMMDNDDWDGITALAREAVLKMLDIKLRHIGINSADETEAVCTTEKFAALTGAEVKDGNKSLFAGTSFEIMKFMGMGKCGHIALSVTDVDRAVTFFKSQGFEFDDASATYSDDGKRKFIYFKDEVGGFAIHLVKA